MSNELNPIPTLEFEPQSFFDATGMFTDDEKFKYLRCLVHYWYHTHAQGIFDDDDGLRQLCQCDADKWPRLKAMIFDGDKFFYLEGGKWHQKRARKSFQKRQLDLMKKQAQTMGARIASGHVTPTVTTPATLSGAMLIFKQNALARVEKRIDQIRANTPIEAKHRPELLELKHERKNLMDELGLKA
jgi:uncharacterized protein YdaU (DUF1376 family)